MNRVLPQRFGASEFSFCDAPMHVINEKTCSTTSSSSSLSFTRRPLQRRSSTGRLERRKVERTMSTRGTNDLSTTKLGQLLADLGMVYNQKPVVRKPNRESSPARCFRHSMFTKTIATLDESDHTSTTEDLSSSSAHWDLSSHNEVNLKEFQPASFVYKSHLTNFMESAKQKHIRKMQLIQQIQTIGQKLDQILEKCRTTKARLAAMAKDESYVTVLSDSEEEVLFSDDDDDDDDSYYSDSELSDDDENQES